jgi:deoxycytidylate deaminase
VDIIAEHLINAYKMASKSPDLSNQNGAVLIDDNFKEISNGNNNFFEKYIINSGQKPEDLVKNRDIKLFYIEHAERSTIFNAVKNNINPVGKVLICPWFACDSCARAIIGCGISKVIGHQQRMNMTPERWKASVDAGLDMLRKCDVEIEFYDGDLNMDFYIKVNGENWKC